MHTADLRRRLRKLIPPAEVRLLPGTDRFDVVAPLPPAGNIGIELGVAAGSFSSRMVQSGRFAQFYGVDVYGDGHNTAEYKKALLAVGLWSDYRLLRMTFDQALDLFPDGYFDFIYCDGYAHTGEEGGRTLADWFPS
ncbi:MAG: methyltransferase domain-containing protein [Paracoccaceae bacterium]